jgi:hypothetical protein
MESWRRQNKPESMVVVHFFLSLSLRLSLPQVLERSDEELGKMEH